MARGMSSRRARLIRFETIQRDCGPSCGHFWESGWSRNRHFLPWMTSSSSLRTRSTTFNAKPKMLLNLPTRHHLVVISVNFRHQPRWCHQGHISCSKQAIVVDSWPTWLLKEFTTDVSPFIVTVCNLSMSTGPVPSSIKMAYIMPLLKKTKQQQRWHNKLSTKF